MLPLGSGRRNSPLKRFLRRRFGNNVEVAHRRVLGWRGMRDFVAFLTGTGEQQQAANPDREAAATGVEANAVAFRMTITFTAHQFLPRLFRVRQALSLISHLRTGFRIDLLAATVFYQGEQRQKMP